MALIRVLLMGLACAFSLDALSSPRANQETLTVYAYDSFMAKDGLGPRILPLFEKTCACRVAIVSVGNAGRILSRVQLDEKRGKPTAHVVVGLDGPTWQLFAPYAADWGQWRPKGYDKLKAEARRKPGFLPFDYGLLGFMQDRRQLEKLGLRPPGSLKELFDPKWRRKLLMQDPRTSTPGLTFVLYVRQLFADEFGQVIRKLKPQWLTLSPGWDASYGLFLKEEAPLIWTYVTSQAQHSSKADERTVRRYESLVFEEGQPMQVEGAALVQATLRQPEQRKLAESFLEFLISEEVQRLVPVHNWMYPAREDVPLPPSFQSLPKHRKVVSLPEDRSVIEETVRRWQEALY